MLDKILITFDIDFAKTLREFSFTVECYQKFLVTMRFFHLTLLLFSLPVYSLPLSGNYSVSQSTSTATLSSNVTSSNEAITKVSDSSVNSPISTVTRAVYSVTSSIPQTTSMTTQTLEIPTGIPEPDTDAENDSEDKENGEGGVIGIVDTISTPVTGILELDRDPGGDHNPRVSNFCFYNCRHE